MAKTVRRRTAVYPYVLLADRDLPPAEQPRFHLRPPTQAERCTMRDNLIRIRVDPDGVHGTIVREGSVAIAACLTNIASVENFPTEAPVPWPADREARASYLEGIDLDAIVELGNEIFAGSVQPRAEEA